MRYTFLETIFRDSVSVYLFTLTRMIPVAEAEGVKLYCPEGGRYAFFNSPYPSHKLNTGVDLYSGEAFGGDAYSPVDGEVVLLKQVKAPSGHGFVAADHESVIVIRNRDNPETVTKLLHADPLVEVGDNLHVGDVIATTIRSGYYGYATSPHFHAEVRHPSDPVRARGGFYLSRIGNAVSEPAEELAGEVVCVQPEFSYIKMESNSIGLVGKAGGRPAFLDGGIPYYGWMGAHIHNPPNSGAIKLLGREVADITQAFNGSCKADCRVFSFSVKGKPILGLSLTLRAVKETLVKIIPFRLDILDVEVGEWLEVRLNASF
jgi:hypothetical protein